MFDVRNHSYVVFCVSSTLLPLIDCRVSGEGRSAWSASRQQSGISIASCEATFDCGALDIKLIQSKYTIEISFSRDM